MKEGLFAIILTSKGEITIQLEFEKTPGTVGNFAGLATGKIKNDIRPIGEPYYNGLKFHRVINDFMVQAGCPLGTGTGDPGYKFDDEFNVISNMIDLEFFLWPTQDHQLMVVNFLLRMLKPLG